MQLTEKELSVLQNTDFLLTKATAINKIYKLLELTRERIKKGLNYLNYFTHWTESMKGNGESC